MRRQSPKPPTPSPRARALAAALLALVPAALGCGDDDGDGVTTAADTAENVYVAQVHDAIDPVLEQSDELTREAERADSIQQLSRPLERAQRGYRRATEELRAINPPDEVAELHEQLVEVHREITNATEAAAKAARQRGGKGLAEFRQAGARYARRTDAILRRFEQRGFDL